MRRDVDETYRYYLVEPSHAKRPPGVMGPGLRRDDAFIESPHRFPAPMYPNKNPATFRIWISSLPSVMR